MTIGSPSPGGSPTRPPLRAPSAPLKRVGYRVSEAAEVLGVSEKTVWRLIADGVLVASRLRGRVVVHESALRTMLEQTRIGGPP